VELGSTILLAPRTRTSSCRAGTLPDRRCSPGAYHSGLTVAALCAPTFRAALLGEVPEAVKSAVEREYGLGPARSRPPIVIDRIVPQELGGTNDIANLFPEPARQASANSKDRLETRLHKLVCSGHIPLAAARMAIAVNWMMLYRLIFHTRP
jgi:hypothetical protein